MGSMRVTNCPSQVGRLVALEHRVLTQRSTSRSPTVCFARLPTRASWCRTVSSGAGEFLGFVGRKGSVVEARWNLRRD
eukprot:5685563-Pyramimonas_sp.AAC.2